MVIPSPIAQVDPAHERDRLVDHDYLLVVRPEENAHFRVVWMPEHL